MNNLTITLEQFEDVATIENRFFELNKRALKIGKKYGDLLQYTNLKLYDLSSYIYDTFEEDEGIKLFNDFTSFEFDYFEDSMIIWNNLTMNHVGRTSSFMILPDEDVYFLDSENLDPIDVYSCLISEVDHNHYTTLSNQIVELFTGEDDPTEFIEEWLYNFECELDQLEHNIELMEEYYKPIKNAYDYIESFKDNQVESFKYFIEGIE